MTRNDGWKHTIIQFVVLTLLLIRPSAVATDTRIGKPGHRQRVTGGPYAEAAPMCSPDGRWLAFEYFDAKHPDAPQIRIMQRDGGLESARPLIDAMQYSGDMSWSPDSHWVALQMDFPTRDQSGPRTDDEQIVKINIQTHELIKLTHFAPNTAIDPTTSWLRTGWIIFSATGDDIMGVPEGGGDLRKFAHLPLDRCSGGMDTLAGSPDGRRIAFEMLNFNPECNALWIADAETGNTVRVPTGVHPASPSWLDDNSLLFSGESDDGKPVGIYRISLRTGKVVRLLEGAYLTPFVCDSGKTLYFSFGPKLQVKGNSWNQFYGFHIWKVSMRDLLQ